MFVKYNNTIHFVLKTLDLKDTNTSIMWLVNCNDTEQNYAVPSDQCQDFSINCYDIDIVQALLRIKHLAYQYSFFGYGELNNPINDYRWKFTYDEKRREVADIIKVMEDGVVCECSNGDIRHFKYEKIYGSRFDDD